jgi:cytidyltransferase-like protein
MIFDLARRYRHKIKTPEELRGLLGAPPRSAKVIMCHGVFDVVHPGHVRHLLFAKSKGDVLIASLTADKFIEKGKYRPHVPQDLRAINLAAFEMVDYVLIDDCATPLKNLGIIQPDYYAKGYEYTANGKLHPRTRDELAVVKSYGGEVLFSPGDVVYSSSKLINLAPPSLKLEKLFILMDREGVTFDQLRQALDAFGGKRVHVVGDTIVDTYTHCGMIFGQTKTPTMSVLFEKKNDFLGGAGVVASHMKAAGADVTLSTVLGNDARKDFVLERLEVSGVRSGAVIDETRPTINKNVVVVGGYHVLKIDTLDNSSISEDVLQRLTSAIRSTPVDSVVYSDFRYGMFNRRTIPAFIEAIPERCYRVGDSQGRWGNILDFQSFDLITPNEREARYALADQDSGVRPLAATLYDSARCKLLILKLGDRGVLTCRGAPHESLDSFFVIDSFVDDLVDPIGAGDALLAYTTLAMLATKNEVIATILGSMAAACECESEGNVPVPPEAVHLKIDAVEGLANQGA